MPRIRWKHPLAAALLLTGTGETARAQYPAGVPCPPAAIPGKAKLPCRPPWPAVPFGAATELYFQTHITNGVATRMTFYDYDFVPDTAQLNSYGRDRLRQVAGWLPHNPFPVTIERMPAAPALAEARRRVVLNELAALLGPVPPERVMVGPSPTTPLRGVETELIYQNLLRLADSAGMSPSTGVGNGTGGTTGATGTGTSPINPQ
jgi:hypothetical protein